MEPLQIFLIVLVIVVVLAMMIYFITQDKGSNKHNVDVIKGQMRSQSSKALKASAQDEQDKRRAEISKKLQETQNNENKGGGNKKTTSMMLEQAGLNISVQQFWLFSLVSMVVVVALAFVMGMSPFVIVMAAVIGLFGVPRYVLKKKTAKRQKMFLEDFPEALEATVRLLKAGMPVSEAILMISREYAGPVGEEMSIIYDKQKIGIPLPEAALECTRRMPLPEMKMFATGLAIQAQTGSSLSEVLMNLSGVIRARFRLKRKVKALSSEAISSAMIIGALPVLVGTGLYFANPEYISLLFTTPLGKLMLTGAAVWMSLGVFVMKTMINFKI